MWPTGGLSTEKATMEWDSVQDVWKSISPTLHSSQFIWERMVILWWWFYSFNISDCALHSWSSSGMGCILQRKGGALSKGLSADMFGFGEVESCNVAQLCNIPRAVSNCIGVSVHLSICMWTCVLENGTHLRFQFI